MFSHHLIVTSSCKDTITSLWSNKVKFQNPGIYRINHALVVPLLHSDTTAHEVKHKYLVLLPEIFVEEMGISIITPLTSLFL